MGKGGMSIDDHVEQQNMAAWLVGINSLKIQPFNLPTLGPHDVRIRMKAVGICGSDVHYLKTDRNRVQNVGFDYGPKPRVWKVYKRKKTKGKGNDDVVKNV
ncbi:hypothetical protein KIW84_013055 [Lathyrus oleraceus]|uniref:Uncharacterized protein n=1 Tax=Pisum sativum TaxID=3888 RepID=A0A9D5BJF4_PEA|nr:hypothetical protein KIW84_013055 [Pisum sativum]